MSRSMLTAAVVILCALAGLQADPKPDEPRSLGPAKDSSCLEAVINAADRVVVAKVTAVSKPEKKTVKLPWSIGRGSTHEFNTATVTVERSLKPVPKKPADPNVPAKRPTTDPRTEGDDGKQRSATNSVDAQSPPEVLTVLYYSPSGPAARGPRQPRQANPAVGKKYVLVLHQLGGDDGYFLMPKTPWWQDADAANVKLYAKTADLDTWPWGKASRGLQVAILAKDGAGVPLAIGATRMKFNFAIRNASDKPLRVNLSPKDSLFVPLLAESAEGVQMEGSMGVMFGTRVPRPRTLELAAGEGVVLTPSDSWHPGTLTFPLQQPGRFFVQLRYQNHLKTTKPDGSGKPMWTGDASSKVLPVNVQRVKGGGVFGD
ncbi:MAG: hypothetical protein ACLFV7_01550 [Phycisphaerae bacterium]